MIEVTRAATNYFFHEICQLFSQSIMLVHKMSEKCPSQFPKAQVDAFKCLVLFNQPRIQNLKIAGLIP